MLNSPFLDKLTLILRARQRFSESDNDIIQNYFNLGKICFDINHLSQSKLKTAGINPFRLISWSLTWLPLTAYCWFNMLRLVEQAVQLAGGYNQLTPSELHIYQNILRCRGRHQKAKIIIGIALGKIPEDACLRAWLRLSLAEIYFHDSPAEAKISLIAALHEAQLAEKNSPRQVAKIYRRAATLIDFLELKGVVFDQTVKNKRQLLMAASALSQD